jgi:hypothetical protein
MHTISIELQLTMKVDIHNQCLNVDLVSPIYVTSSELEFHKPPDHKMDAGDTIRPAFIIKSDDTSYGVLMYKLQRKQSHKSTEISEDTSSVAYLLAVWRVSESMELCSDVLLVEHNGMFDKDSLEKLYNKNINQFRLCPNSVTETWSLNNNTTLMTTFEIKNGGQLLDITISEVERDNCARIPIRIDIEK